MTQAAWAELQQRLLLRYKDFKRRLTHYLGSADLAGDALQDTWLRLERGGELSAVRSPDNYLYSMAINIARNRQRAEKRRLTMSEVETLFEIADETPDAERIMAARSELESVVAIIGELPVRQQAILLAARIEGTPRRDIARRFAVSERFVQRELQAAHDYCARRSEELSREKFTSGAREASTGQKPSERAKGKSTRPDSAEE